LYEKQQELAFKPVENEDIVSFNGIAFRQIEEIKQLPSELELSFGDYLDHIYEENGSIKHHMKNYEIRSGQREMSEAIYDSIQSKSHALIEAETGTGKSLAYLIPAIYEAVKSKQRIIISTYTTQLQTQLLEEEIPLVQKIVGFPFKTALLKGKSHYISLEKFAHELNLNQQDNYDITLTKAMILIWLTETETGDIDELHLSSSGYSFYKRVSTDAERMLDTYSPWFSKSYYQRAKRSAQQADIIITNHALLCTDMFNDYQFLPRYHKVIIDEAHHLEDTVSHHYGLKLDHNNMQYILNQIGETEDDKLLGRLLTNYSIDRIELPLEKWNTILSDTKYEMDDLFQLLFQYVITKQKNSKSLSDIGRIQYRFNSETEDSKKWRVIKEMVTRLTFFFRDMIHILTIVEQHFEKDALLDKYDQDDLHGIIKLLQSFIDNLELMFLLEATVPQVKWIEIEAKSTRNAVYLYSEPTDVSTLLAHDFFDKKESVILTSATLTMNNSFTFIQNRLGLPMDRLITKKFNSPFTYQDQVQLMIPNDFPDIKHGNLDDFIYATCEAILSLAEITDGRMLVLFTSYDMLRKSYHLLREIIDTDKYVLIGQGISSGSRARLKKNFQTFNQAILLGTSSFWEGVDIPGDDLSSLVIVRLPFQPPTHPVFEAKSNYLKEQGKNAFMELSLPNAVIRFKQGFGRLIRSTNDRGIVFICDARIVNTRYGKYFTNSIPPVPITYDSTQKLMSKAEEWF